MNYARATKGTLSHDGLLREVDCQSELELGRRLDPSEKAVLFKRFPPDMVVSRINKYGYGVLKFMWYMCKRPELKCDISPAPTPRDGNCLLHAISDGVEENDAFRHTAGDTHHEKWTQLLLDLEFFDEHSNHIMDLRRRFVWGAADWLAGNNGSLRNDKEIMGYSDSQWEFIWNTMLEDGAWAVPSITDLHGNITKENFAPELLLKYIAHDLKCHIIVFDLVLDRTQFISGNHLTKGNVVFDSPLLLYATGSHFQAVFQHDHEFFVNLARDMDAQNELPLDTSIIHNQGKDQPGKSIISGTGSILTSNTKPCGMVRKISSPTIEAAQTVSNQKSDSNSNRIDEMEAARVKPRGAVKTGLSGPTGEGQEEVVYVCTSNVDNARLSKADHMGKNIHSTHSTQDLQIDEHFELIGQMKKKDRSPSQQRYFEKIKKQRQRKGQSQVESITRKQKDKEQKREKRGKETAKEAELRQQKDQEQKKLKRLNETSKEAELRKEKNQEHMKEMRMKETAKEAELRLKKNQEHMKEMRMKETAKEAELRLKKNQEHMKEMRMKETAKETELRQKKNQEHMKEMRMKETTKVAELRQQKDQEQKKQKRLKETAKEAKLRKEKNQEHMKDMRMQETPEEAELRQQKNQEHMKEMRMKETGNEAKLRQKKNQEHMKEMRMKETAKEAELRKFKDLKQKNKKQSNNSEYQRLQKFRQSVRYGPIFTCTVCEQDLFEQSVKTLNQHLVGFVQETSPELFKLVLSDPKVVEINGEEDVYICGTCEKHLKKCDLPPMAAANGLKVVGCSRDISITDLENSLIARRILFQKIYQLPKSRMAACKDHLINIPIGANDVINTLSCLPRTPDEAGLLEVKLKRKIEYKNSHQQAYIDTERIYKALNYLKTSGHPEYQFFDDLGEYTKRCRDKLKIDFVSDDSVENIMEIDEYEKLLEYRKEIISQGKELDEDEEYMKNDVVRKFQFDYDTSVCLVDKYPEATITEDISHEHNMLSIAPGEGKKPENILMTKDWDRNAFPMKHPDGENHLHHQRERRLTDQYYFVQRLRNKDTRFSNDPTYIFAAASYLEKKQLQSNINVSYQRGREIRGEDGKPTYHLEDGFSVFDKISNTPKYWKTAKYEMLAKLDNLGPFQFFFTLSCADMRWDDNFSTILRKLGMRIRYTTSSGIDDDDGCGDDVTLVLYKTENGEDATMELHEYLKTKVDSSMHELIRRHVFIATQNYQQRVKSFIKEIVTDKNNPMQVEYWSTKVEFQGRGAAHNHGTLWVDMKKMELTFLDTDGKWQTIDNTIKSPVSEAIPIKEEIKRLLNIHYNVKKEFQGDDFDSLKQISERLRLDNDSKSTNTQSDLSNNLAKHFPFFGLQSAFKKFQTKEKLLDHEEKAVIAFADKFTTCTLNEATIASKTDDEILKKRAKDVVKIVKEVNIHTDTKSCRKYDTECRYGFPRYPIWRTLISRPFEDSSEDSKALKEKYDKILSDVKNILKDKEVIEEILKDIPKDQDTTVDRYKENRKKRIVKLLAIAGLTTDEEIQQYEDALKYSSTGYSIILERDIDELFVNSYNPEWARAWNGNTDLQICLDYFAVITYITEYYTKDDTGLMTKLLEMLKNSQCETLRDKMKLVMNTFISARQMGECEAIYKIMPNFHLKDSNVATIIIPTAPKEERSKFMIKVDEREDYNGREKKAIEGREGMFVEKYDLIDKYVRRDIKCREIDELVTVQFFKMMTPSSKEGSEGRDMDSIDDEEGDMEENDENGSNPDNKWDYVMTASKNKKVKLPECIKIDNPFPGEPKFMRKRRKPAVIRFHKFRQDVDPAKYFYAEALLYTPFRSEIELLDRVSKAAEDGYAKLQEQINAVKSQVMEFLESNEEARFMVEEASAKIKETGEALDPEGDQDNQECINESLALHPDYEHLNPDELGVTERCARPEKIYRPIEIDDIKVLREKTRKLDIHQRRVIEKGVQLSRRIVKALSEKNPPSESVRVIVHGGAGTGKSTVINILKQWCQLILQQPGDNPDCPYIIVAAPTGTAAANIRGQTMHSAFNFSWGNEHFSLSDKKRDEKRNLLKCLKLVIIDEISMVKSDQQFQLDKRLREVTQKVHNVFGNVSIFYVGDVMQLKPCQGRFIFEEPLNPDYKIDYHLGIHWKSFEVIILEKNHRQGEDKEYADMLNRFRVGQQTEEDMQKLQDRVRPMYHQDLSGAMYVTSKNKEVENINMKQLREIKDVPTILKAVNIHPTIQNFEPPLGKKGEVMNTPFLKTLQIKKKARVQLTYNIDTLDCLTNGSRGEVVDFVRKADGYVEKIMVKFDETHQGLQKRTEHPELTARYPGCTPIERVMFQYSLAKKSKKVSSTAKVIQFPISLCFAATSHKFQGQTVRKPHKLAANFKTVFAAAQAYVMLSRVETINQLFIIDCVPDNKFYASPKALDELDRLKKVSINKNLPLWEQQDIWSLRISSLNCRSLKDKFEDLRHDPFLLLSDVICLQETWLKSDHMEETLQIPEFKLHLNSVGDGKGIATYYRDEKASPQADTKMPKTQISKLSTKEVDIINIYRSQSADNLCLSEELKRLINAQRQTIVCGDLNLCFVSQRKNEVTTMLENLGFRQMVKTATHLMGGHIDHVYSNHDQNKLQVDVMIYSPYYTCKDHDALCITIRHSSCPKK